MNDSKRAPQKNQHRTRPKPLIAYALKYWPRYLVVLVTLLIAVSLNALTPQVLGRIIDDVVVGGKTEMLMSLLIMLVIVGVGHGIFNYIKEYNADRIGVLVGKDLRRDLFEHIQRLSANFFSKNNTGELMARVKDDVDRVWFIMGFAGMLIFECVIHSAVTLFFMARVSLLLTALPVAIMIVVGIIALIMEKKLNKCWDDISNENAELTTIAQENLSGVRTVKAFSREKFEKEKFASHNQKYYDLNMNMARVLIRFHPIISVASKLLITLVIILGGLLIIFDYNNLTLGSDGTLFSIGGSKLTLGGLTAFVEYANGIIWPMECIGWLSNELAGAIASNRKIRKIMLEQPEIQSPEDAVVLDDVQGHVTFDNVSFRMGETEILRNVSFDLPAGKTIGIMGMTGSGKSTIVNLLERFYDLTEGSIMLDGVDVRKLSLATLRGGISVVSQDVFLFSDSIEENIKLGSRDRISAERMQSASRSACAAEFIEKLSNRYDTIIGERGVGLSGGQKQRISIARAIAKNAPILVLDDATSALDMETEHDIQRSLGLLQDVTKIIIAHRISAVKDADEIIVLEEGSIVERGTHEQLMALDGRYRETYSAQYGA